jgi:exopolysaccharide biosynthesis WecB/TagA/CpsF family protein
MVVDTKYIYNEMATRTLLGVNISCLKSEEAVKYILNRLFLRVQTKVAFANANLLVQLQHGETKQKVLDDFIVLNDGVAVDMGSLLLYGSTFPDNLNGTDFVTRLLSAIPRGNRVFLYGARPAVVEKAAAEIERRFGLTVCGYVDGYRPPSESNAIVQQMIDAKPDVVLVALGNPAQEAWIAKNSKLLPASLFLALGAWVDFLTEDKKRAPKLLRMMRFEWLFRLYLEPKRLWRRYSVDTIVFFLLVFEQFLSGFRISKETKKHA